MAYQLQTGVARRTISPPKGIYLIGYGDRSKGNQGVHDDLSATAIVLDDGQQRVALVACDLLAINEIIVAQIQDKLDFPVLICCSHTHSGPIAYAGKNSPKRNRKYIAFLVDQIIQAVKEAAASLQPAQLALGSGEASIAVNRREHKFDGTIEIGVNPDGAVDRSLVLLQFQTPEGEPLANFVNFACFTGPLLLCRHRPG